MTATPPDPPGDLTQYRLGKIEEGNAAILKKIEDLPDKFVGQRQHADYEQLVANKFDHQGGEIADLRTRLDDNDGRTERLEEARAARISNKSIAAWSAVAAGGVAILSVLLPYVISAFGHLAGAK